MTATTTTFTVRGHTVRTRTARRYAVVCVRPEPVEYNGQHYVAFAEVETRTDNLERARTLKRRYGFTAVGTSLVIVDLITGEEVR